MRDYEALEAAESRERWEDDRDKEMAKAEATIRDLEAARDSYRDEKRALETRCDKMSAEIERMRRRADDIKRLYVDECKDRHDFEKRVWTLEKALTPFALFAECFDATPMRGLGDTLYAIHGGITGKEAELRLSDCRAARNAMLGKEDK